MLDSEVEVTAQFHLLVDVYAHLLRNLLSLALLRNIILVINLMCLEVHALFVTPDDSEIESINNLKVRLALPGAGHIGDRVYHHFLRGFQDRGIHLAFVHLLEILNIANL